MQASPPFSNPIVRSSSCRLQSLSWQGANHHIMLRSILLRSDVFRRQKAMLEPTIAVLLALRLYEARNQCCQIFCLYLIKKKINIINRLKKIVILLYVPVCAFDSARARCNHLDQRKGCTRVPQNHKLPKTANTIYPLGRFCGFHPLRYHCSPTSTAGNVGDFTNQSAPTLSESI